MGETPQQVYFIAAAAVGIILTILGFFIAKTIATSNLFQKGVTLYKQKDYQGAEAAFRQTIERNRNNDMIRLLLGNALMEQEKLDEAIAMLRELIERSPKNADAYLGLGKALIEQDKLEEAIAILEKARNLYKPQSSEQKNLEELIKQMQAAK